MVAGAWFEQQSVFGEAQLMIVVFEPSPLIATVARPQLTALDPAIEEQLTLESLWPWKAQSHKNLVVLRRTSLISVNLLAPSLRDL